jgi:hypothetical protein
MSTTGTYCEIFNRWLGIPRSTAMDTAQILRHEPAILRSGKRGRGALTLTPAEVNNWLIALVAGKATTRAAPDAIETVRDVRAARRVTDPDLDDCVAIADLSVAKAQTAGEALDALLHDMRTGAWQQWTGGPHMDGFELTGSLGFVRLRFINNGRTVIFNFWRTIAGPPRQQESAVLIFRNSERPEQTGMYLTFTHELDGNALWRIADALNAPS